MFIFQPTAFNDHHCLVGQIRIAAAYSRPASCNSGRVGAQLTRQLNLLRAVSPSAEPDPFTGRSWRLAPQAAASAGEHRATQYATRHQSDRPAPAPPPPREAPDSLPPGIAGSHRTGKMSSAISFWRITSVEPVDRINEISPQSLRKLRHAAAGNPASSASVIAACAARQAWSARPIQQQHSMSPPTL